MFLYRQWALYVYVLSFNFPSSAQQDVFVDSNQFYKLSVFQDAFNTFTTQPLDIVFVLDESGSVGPEPYETEKSFVEILARSLNISADTTRTALVSFGFHAKLHFNYLARTDGNPCNFMKDLKGVIYAGGSTHTASGLNMAQNVLLNSRSNTKKVVILLSDGQSNDGENPVITSGRLKAAGIIMFCVGIAQAKEAELLGIASSPSYVYIISDFEYVKQVYFQLRQDISNVGLVRQSKGFCQGACDLNADCYCGSDGIYECLCNPGYVGTGDVGFCTKCPFGTYNPKVNQMQCEHCPFNANTTHEAATSENACQCDAGFTGTGCKFAGCKNLHAPIGGHLDPEQCGTGLNDKCSFWCDPGYCAYDGTEQNCLKTKSQRIQSPPRVCLITGKWSGRSFHCEKARCKAPQNPENGIFQCDSTGYELRTICNVKCKSGFKAEQGNRKIRCQDNGLWKNIDEVKCKAATCPPLDLKKMITLKPEDCGKINQPYNRQCQIYCKEGYKYEGTSKTNAVKVSSPYGIRTCNTTGWEGKESYTCRDITPPVITCPKSFMVDCCPKNQKVSKKVKWDLPTAIDNDGLPPDIDIIYPPYEKKKEKVKPSYRFPPGRNKLVYEAKDKEKLTSTCSFEIEVIDKNPPTIEFCPQPIDYYTTSTDPITVDWNEPEFHDDSDNVKVIFQSHKPQKDKFTTNDVHKVKYVAADGYDHKITCEFEIRLNPYQCQYRRPPLHGTLQCSKLRRPKSGQECTVGCDDGFGFAENPLDVYNCFVEGGVPDWHPDKNWPDCSKKNDVTTTTTQVEIRGQVDCMKLKTNDAYAQRVVEELCKNRPKCNIERIKTKCEKRRKNPRSKRDLYDDEESVLIIEFDINLNETLELYNESKTLEEIEAEQHKQLQTALENFARNEENSGLNITITKNLTATCDVGQIFRKGKCINCPLGTYFNRGKCLRCSNNTYQDKQASIKCIPCPANTFTVGPGSINISYCLKSCVPGTYSKTGLEQCTGCAKGFYQDLPLQTSCKPCPALTFTWVVGADSVDNCLSKCKPGSYSPTGYEPCDLCPRGSYQPEEGQITCISCNGTLYTVTEGMTKESTCIEVDMCFPNPCQYNGNCTIGKSYEPECQCIEGIAGPLCEINIDDCSDRLCLNDGICIDEIDDYSCKCAPGFEGLRCEYNVDDCKDAPCLHGGTCKDGTNTFTCECLKGYAGRRCEFALDKCDSNPCLNYANCINQRDGFLCCCKRGFSGSFCEIKDNDCANSNPCLHGSTCSQAGNKLKCICTVGYTGVNCETNMDDCAARPCENDGICTDLVNDFECKCHPGFEGKKCEIELPTDFDVEFTTAKISNYAIIETKEDLMSITVMFWMKADSNSISRGTPVSFSYKSPINGSVIDNAITWYDVNKFMVYIQNQKIRTAIQGDSQWHNYALTWDSFSGSYSIYVDGIFVFGGPNISPGLPLFKGFFVLGQEQDLLAGGFSSTESFVGLISQFNVWNFVMNEKEIAKYSKSCGYVGNVIAWPNVKNKLVGNGVYARAAGHCSVIGTCGTSAECFCQKNNIRNANLCEKSLETCAGVVCLNGQKCVNDNGTQICKCKIGLSGRFCQHDINECYTNNGNCSHECHNTLGSYYCKCPADYYMSDDKHVCLPINRCSYKNSLYRDGQSWEENCETCQCKKGTVSCEKTICPELQCSGKAAIFPGDCCKKCVDKKIINCVVLPNDLYQTFDNDRSMKFKATCRHVLAQDCSDGSFSVHIINSNEKTSKRKKIFINIGCEKIKINFDGAVELHEKIINLPYDDGKLLRVEKELGQIGSTKEAVLVTIHNGVIIEWSSYGRIEVKVPEYLKGKMCGLCGNFNGNPNDEWMTRNYQQATTMTDFAFNWRVNKRMCSPPEYEVRGTPEFRKLGACRQARFRDKWQSAQLICQLLRDSEFHPCYPFVDPQEYMDLCLQDGCRCGEKLCHCEAIKSYKDECDKHVSLEVISKSSCSNI